MFKGRGIGGRVKKTNSKRGLNQEGLAIYCFKVIFGQKLKL